VTYRNQTTALLHSQAFAVCGVSLSKKVLQVTLVITPSSAHAAQTHAEKSRPMTSLYTWSGYYLVVSFRRPSVRCLLRAKIERASRVRQNHRYVITAIGIILGRPQHLFDGGPNDRTEISQLHDLA
jgi:hypothetical protein